MFSDHLLQGKKREPLSGPLNEQYLPGLYRYVMYRTGDAALAESITVKILRTALTARAGSGKTGKWTVPLFSAACEELRRSDPAGAFPAFDGLSPLERDAVALRLGARLDVRTISKILGLSPSNVRAVIYRSLCKMTPGINDGT